MKTCYAVFSNNTRSSARQAMHTNWHSVQRHSRLWSCHSMSTWRSDSRRERSHNWSPGSGSSRYTSWNTNMFQMGCRCKVHTLLHIGTLLCPGLHRLSRWLSGRCLVQSLVYTQYTHSDTNTNINQHQHTDNNYSINFKFALCDQAEQSDIV